MPARAKRPMRSQRARLTAGGGVAHGACSIGVWLRRSNRFDPRAVGHGRIDLRDAVILRVRWPLRQTCARCPRVALPRSRDADPEVRPCLRTAPPWPTSPPPRTSPCRRPRSRSPAPARSPRRPGSGSSTPPPRSTTPGPTRSVASCAVAGPGSSASSSATPCAARSATPSRSRCSTAWSARSARSTSASCSSPARATRAAPRSTRCSRPPPWTSPCIMWGGTTDDPMLGALRRRGTPTVLVEGQQAAGRGLGRHRRPRRDAPGHRAPARARPHPDRHRHAAVRPLPQRGARRRRPAWTTSTGRSPAAGWPA